MAALYEVWAFDAFGTKVGVIPLDRISKIQYGLAANAVGALTLTTTVDAIADQYIVRDAMFEVWRKPDGGSWAREGNTCWFLQKATIGQSRQTGEYRRLSAVTCNDLLRRRSVMSSSGNGPFSGPVSSPADDLIKILWTYAAGSGLGTDADHSDIYVNYIGAGAPTRRWDTYITIDASVSAGPSVTKEYASRNCLAVFQEICRDAAGLGTPVYFDLVPTGGRTFALRTWATVRGTDRSTGTQRLVVSVDRGNLSGTVEKTTDWSNIATLVIAGGQGQQVARVYGYAFDNTRISESTFGLIEYFLEATSLTTTASCNAAARAELQQRRPVKTLVGALQSVTGTTYGVDWFLGDRIIAEHRNEQFTARIDNVSVVVDKGQETVTAAIQGES